MLERAAQHGVGMLVDGFYQHAPHAAVGAGNGNF